MGATGAVLHGCLQLGGGGLPSSIIQQPHSQVFTQNEGRHVHTKTSVGCLQQLYLQLPKLRNHPNVCHLVKGCTNGALLRNKKEKLLTHFLKM